MTSWKSTAAGGLRNGPAGLPARMASISRTPARLHFVRREVFEISGDRISKENALIITGGKPGWICPGDGDAGDAYAVGGQAGTAI